MRFSVSTAGNTLAELIAWKITGLHELQRFRTFVHSNRSCHILATVIAFEYLMVRFVIFRRSVCESAGNYQFLCITWHCSAVYIHFKSAFLIITTNLETCNFVLNSWLLLCVNRLQRLYLNLAVDFTVYRCKYIYWSSVR